VKLRGLLESNNVLESQARYLRGKFIDDTIPFIKLKNGRVYLTKDTPLKLKRDEFWFYPTEDNDFKGDMKYWLGVGYDTYHITDLREDIFGISEDTYETE